MMPSTLGFLASLLVLGLLFYAARTSAVILRSVYFIVLVFVSLAAAAFLFGVLKKSSVQYQGPLPGPHDSVPQGKLVATGPAALFLVVLILGFLLAPPEQKRTLKVFPFGPNGKQDVVTSAVVSVTLASGSDSASYSPTKVTEFGYAPFEGIPVALTSGQIHVVVSAEHYKQPQTEYEFPRDGTLYVALERVPVSCTLNGIVEWQHPARKPIPGARIQISGMDGFFKTDAFGTFKGDVPFECGAKVDAVVQDPRGNNFQTTIVVPQDGKTRSEIVLPPT